MDHVDAAVWSAWVHYARATGTWVSLDQAVVRVGFVLNRRPHPHPFGQQQQPPALDAFRDALSALAAARPGVSSLLAVWIGTGYREQAVPMRGDLALGGEQCQTKEVIKIL